MKQFNFNLFRKPAIALAMSAAFLLGSCKDDDDEMVASQTVAEIVIADNNFSLLETAVVHAGLATC